MDYNSLLEQSNLLKSANMNLEQLILQADVVDKLKVMENFVLVSVEIERLSKAYVQLEILYQKQLQSEEQHKNKIVTLLKQNDNLNQMVMDIQRKFVNVTSQVDKSSIQNINDANKKIGILINVNAQMEVNIQQLQRDNQKLAEQCTESNQEVNFAIQSLQECEDSFKLQIGKQQTIIKSMETQISHSNNEIDKKDKKIEQIIKQNSDLIKDIELLDNNIKMQTKQIQQLTKAYQHLEQEYEQHRIKSQSNISEFDSLNKRLEHKNEIIVDIEKKQDKLTLLVRELEIRLSEKETKINILQSQNGELSKQLLQSNTNAQQMIIDQDESSKMLKEQINQLEQQYKSIKHDHDTQYSQIVEQQQLVQVKEAEIQKHQQLITVLKQDHQEMKKVIMELNQALQVQKEMFQRSQIEQADLKDSMLSLQDQSHIQVRLMKAEDLNRNQSYQIAQMEDALIYYKQQIYVLTQQNEDLKETKNYLSSIRRGY